MPQLLDAHVPHGTVLLVSNTTVAPLYGDALKRGLKDRHIVEAILPDGESYKTLATLSRILDVAVANRLARDSTRGRPRRRCRGRHGGICGGLLPARRRLRPGSDHAAGAGRLLGRRQDRREPSRRQEPHRCLPSAGRGDRRHQYPGHPAAAGTARGARRGHQVRPDPRCGLL